MQIFSPKNRLYMHEDRPKLCDISSAVGDIVCLWAIIIADYIPLKVTFMRINRRYIAENYSILVYNYI